MPELPEVETVRRDLQKSLLNKKITHIDIKLNRLIKNPVDFFIAKLEGNSFADIERIGKLLMFKLKRDHTWLLIHLKMTGQLVYRLGEKTVYGGHSLSASNHIVSEKYDWVTFRFADGSYLTFNDMRTFGYLKLISNEDQQRIVRENFGIDALHNDFSLAHVRDILRDRKTSLKAVLLNQQLIAGIGNIYADEICFAAGVKPSRRANTLTPAEIKKIYLHTKKILAKAVKYRGTTFSTFVDGHGHGGNFRQHLKAYGRQGLSCLRCKTGVIQKKKIAGRGTSFCNNCQK